MTSTWSMMTGSGTPTSAKGDCLAPCQLLEASDMARPQKLLASNSAVLLSHLSRSCLTSWNPRHPTTHDISRPSSYKRPTGLGRKIISLHHSIGLSPQVKSTNPFAIESPACGSSLSAIFCTSQGSSQLKPAWKYRIGLSNSTSSDLHSFSVSLTFTWNYLCSDMEMT